jgi:ribonucleotide reductase alpha subunit/intein/homing endonuclease
LAGGGTASGPVSFMRGADSSAGTIKSGGKTRRAAKMVILNADHPDIEEFVWCKAKEERKARVLRDAGFDMDLDGADSHSIQYQNANNSVRVTDEFMQAVIDGEDWALTAVTDGSTIKSIAARDLMHQIAEAAWECADPGVQYDTTINRWHTAPNTGRINGSNPCSEYVHLDDSACNLASINLLKYLDEGSNFDVEAFRHTVEVVFTAQEILVGNADYPTERIGETSRAFRQLGLGYANLGALLMAQGLPYDSDEGRAWAGAITALMTGHAYATSARTAGRMGPFAGYAENADAMLNVLRMHRAAAAEIDEELVPSELLSAAQRSWDEAVEGGEIHGVRNSQASVLAPTGCLVGGTLVATERGLVRLGSLGNPIGDAWQPLGIDVATDEGPREATQFYVNGVEPVVDITTSRGYRIRGTAKHRIKVVDESGEWVWRRFADVRSGDRVPLMLDQLVGSPNEVVLPPLPEAHWTGEHDVHVPRTVTPELAEFVGYFMGDGSVDDSGLRLVVRGDDFDVADHLAVLAKSLFGVEFAAGPEKANIVLELASRKVAAWWRESGFASRSEIAEAVLRTNDREVYGALLRGYFDARGEVVNGSPVCDIDVETLADEIQTLLLALGFVTSRRERQIDVEVTDRWQNEIGFVGFRKARAIHVIDGQRRLVAIDTISSAELGDEEFTFDISVPDNVTYVANGFVSHNTIGLMMDCDTTGIEPDLALTKAKKLVGGGTMLIVNQTIPRALRKLGYSDDEADAIVAYINEHKTIIGAPGFEIEHLPVFACSMGDNPIHYMGHVKMMAAAQPFLSGAISKCVVGGTLLTTSDGLVRIGSLHDGEAPDSFRDELIEVASIEGPQKTDAFYYGGTRRVREVVLRSGHRIVATPNHRLLTAGHGGVEWLATEDILRGEYVAVQYGAEMWSAVPARFDDFVATRRYGSQKRVSIPTDMSEELAFLVGAYVAEGHTTRSNWTISITNSVETVLTRVADAWQALFGVEARIVRPVDRCAAVVVASKEIVEFLEYLGCGARASEKRIPDAVLRSPREMVVAFLQGLALDAYVTTVSAPKWAICVDSPGLLDDLQAVLTNLGIVHGRVTKHNNDNGKDYGEVYVTGRDAQHLTEFVPFLEPDKAVRAAELRALVIDRRRDTADVVPGVSPRELYELIPKGSPGRSGAGSGIAKEFGFLCDPRTRHVTRATLERVARVDGVHLPYWLSMVLIDNLHFSPVESVRDAGLSEVFDVSVPSTHAFVGNGIVNHNTVNLPEEVTIEDVEDVYLESWRLGLKAVAIYRDNCKVGQPLSTQKKAGDEKADAVERIVETVIVQQPVRQKLPRTRTSKTFSFRVADCHGYATVGEYEDGRPGEVFLKVAKQGSTLAGIMDAFAISVSHGLQYGVPLRAFVDMFTNMRFEPAGMTDDPDIRFATSLVDYIFRRLAVEYLSYDERQELGILTVGERIQPTLPGVEETTTPVQSGFDLLPPEDRAPSDALQSAPPALPAAEIGRREAELVLCYVCGDIMQRAGSCHACPSCGATSGCS